MEFFLSSDIHQGDELFSVQSEGEAMCFHEFIGYFNSLKYPTDRLVKNNI